MFLYAVKRGPDGVMEVEAPPARFPNLRELHRRRCFLLGITDPAKEERLWAEEVRRREAAQRPGRRERRT
ncbi:hypothetical protein R5W24_003888 [Gemmata sp. JC717]|uniref:Uncharacterized protein n=1 Tax=Gemmata algarum TaxID=2975278 RepID=A0ABU5EVB6_9BACT|nr:hypothetical protein [Gemmata algarum]MDY3554759.1 hypothetical protein [Gemmata algarum]MDY3558405.1 hypothetical protein [Gemmata algarum]